MQDRHANVRQRTEIQWLIRVFFNLSQKPSIHPPKAKKNSLCLLILR